MGDVVIPEELLIIGASIKYRTSSPVPFALVEKYRSACPFPIIYEEEGFEFKNTKVGEKGFEIINMPNINPLLLKILLSFG